MSDKPVKKAKEPKKTAPLSTRAKPAISEDAQKKRKKQIKYGMIGLGVSLFALFIFWAMQPMKSTLFYGMCKTFLELNVQYPQSLYISTVEQMGTSVRIWYAQTDGFGQYRLEPIQCFFKEDKNSGFILDKVTIRRRELPKETIAQFNKSIGVLLQHPPDLTLPAPLPDSLKDLQLDRGKFARPLFQP